MWTSGQPWESVLCLLRYLFFENFPQYTFIFFPFFQLLPDPLPPPYPPNVMVFHSQTNMESGWLASYF